MIICTYYRCIFSFSCWKWIAFDNPTAIDSILAWCTVRVDLSTMSMSLIHLENCGPLSCSFCQNRFDCRTFKEASRVRYVKVCEGLNWVKVVINYVFCLLLVTCSNLYHWLVRPDLTIDPLDVVSNLTIDTLNVVSDLSRSQTIFYLVRWVFQTLLTSDFLFFNIVVNQVMIYHHLRWFYFFCLHIEIVISKDFYHNKRSCLNRRHIASCLIENKCFP